MSDNKNVLIEVRDLCKSFDHVKVLNGISTTISQGEVVAIIGPSGCGKSTFLRSMNLLEKPTSGSILFEGTDITDASVDIDVMREKIGMVFQQFNLFPHFSVLKNIVDAPLKVQKRKKDEVYAQARSLLKKMGLADKEKAYPFQLSGGQQQRVAIARAIATHPPIIMADEPTGALDSKTGKHVLEILHSLHEGGSTIILITHDLGVVANVADRVAVMYAGQIVEYGTVEEIFYDAWHPYTWALLQALPQLGTKGEALPSVDGTPPNLFNEIKGDAFAPRNKHALAIDFVQEPPFFQVSETHAAKTWYLDPRAPKIERPHSIQNLREKMGKMGGANLNG